MKLVRASAWEVKEGGTLLRLCQMANQVELYLGVLRPEG